MYTMTPEKLWQEAQESGYPSDFAGPAHLYTTHWPFFGWADRGDDLVAESNYHVAAEILSAVEDSEHEDGLPDVITGSTRHWLVGSLMQVWVRAFNDQGYFTQAWIEAANLITEYQNYPILDESDHSEREMEEHYRQYDSAIERARDEDLEAIIPDRVEDLLDTVRQRYMDTSCDWPDVDRDEVENIYLAVMHEMLTEYGQEIWDAYVTDLRESERATYDTDLLELAGN